MKFNDEMARDADLVKQTRIADLEKCILVGNEYLHLKQSPGWAKLEAEITSRTNAQMGAVLRQKDTTVLFRMQGEILALQGVVSIVESAIEDAREAQTELEEIRGGTENGNTESN